MAEHGTAQAALDALPEVAREAGVTGYTVCPEGVALAELKAARTAVARMVCYGEAAYPAALYDLPDAPPILWAMGDVSLMSRPMVALVGARNASSLGTRMAKALATGLSEAGFIVASGLARGIDTAAHLAALPKGTVAVMAGGVDVIYPTENTPLAEKIAAIGLRLSEQPMGMSPQARHFPTRNRIISGLSQAVVVVEAAAKSGSLITARNALDQGRDVLAVPGHPFDARASGCNMLIRDGAILVRGVGDVLDAMRQPEPQQPVLDLQPPEPEKTTPPKRTLAQTAALHTQILSRLGPSPVAEDQLIRDLKVSAHSVAPVLLNLELEGKITRQSGGLLSLVH
jgi:DNA processing protein